jgi:hypothetical protein
MAEEEGILQVVDSDVGLVLAEELDVRRGKDGILEERDVQLAKEVGGRSE